MPIQTRASGASVEYILLVAFLIAIAALATDIMLSGLDDIARDLGAPAIDAHYVITAFFLGMAAGQMVVGPLSDSFGRKPVIYGGYALFVAGCLVCLVTDSWAVLLAGRVLQGLGAAAPRIVTVALVRDRFEGRIMARIMSFAMAVFIIVPIVAPALGLGLIHLGGWRSIFVGLAVLAAVVSLWFAGRLPETLEPAQRRPFRLKAIWRGLAEIMGTRVALGYTLAAGLISGVFVGYLGSAQQIFAETFGIGDLFVLLFALASASLGAASLVNAALVMRFGMRRLTWAAILGLTGLSAAFWAALPAYAGAPPLTLFLLWQLPAFFCIGIVFGNLNALALEPLGHMAGLGAAFVGSLATFLALPLAAAIGAAFDGTVYALIAGFTLAGLAMSAVVVWTHRESDPV